MFSPSWRSNLIGALVNNEREELPEVFMESDFFKQVSAFLNSERLHDMLEKTISISISRTIRYSNATTICLI